VHVGDESAFLKLDRQAQAQGQGDSWLVTAVRWTGWSLAAATWVSGALFGLYILLFFGGAAAHGALDRWNESLDHLHPVNAPAATAGIGFHFLAGGLLLILGPIQLIGGIRRAVPAFHRWLGRLYVLSAGIAGAGGLTFILANGTVGGPVMSTGFGLYGALVVTAAMVSYVHARARRLETHRAWAIRLFALVVGSWLYRMEYAFWFMAIGRAGHTTSFHGLFDHVMTFFFYLPNLAVAELFIRSRSGSGSNATKAGACAVLLGATAFVVTATTYFTANYWGPGMVSGITGAPL